MISNLTSRGRKAVQTFDVARTTPWSTLGWGVFVPAVFLGNVVLAIFAWFVVERAMKLMLM
jgi:hypothetical protein